MELQQAYRLHSLQSAIYGQIAENLFRCLRSAGVTPILGKGWAVARLYPETGLRPYGDFDLYVHPDQYDRAASALRSPEVADIPVDLHNGFPDLNDREFDSLFARSQTIQAGSAEISLLCEEDHLRLLSIHMMRHGAWRPLWLCDIGVVLETSTGGFDWDYFLSGNERSTAWVVSAVLLASELLDARVDTAHLVRWSKPLPGWLISTVLRQWGDPPIPHGLRTPMRMYVNRPIEFCRELMVRWPNPIEATVGIGGAVNNLPRLPYQLAECVSRTARFVLGLTRER